MKPYYQDKWVTIYHGDCLEILPQLDLTVSAVVSDPPYPKEFLPHYPNWFAACDRLLSSPGTCIIMVGQMYLPVVFASFPPTWEYLWTGCCEQRQMSAAIWPRGISTAWKPLVILGKGFTKFKNWQPDVITAQGGYKVGKDLHKWGQAINQFTTAIARFAVDGIVLDPLMGSGTTLMAAKILNRQSIGIDLEEKSCEVAARRCSQEVMDFSEA